MTLTTVLASLDAALKPKKTRPAKKASLTVHPELEAIWQWGRASEVLEHAELETVAAESDDWWWSQVWLSPAQALSAQKELREVPGFPAALVPFATDEAGNYTCHDPKTGKLVDWDHETRKTRKLPGSLTTIFTVVLKLLKDEAKADAKTAKRKPPASASKAEAPKSGAFPKAIVAAKAKVLRKLSASHRLHGFNGATISGDGKLVAGAVYGSRAACFGELASDVELVPSEPGLAEQKKTMGFVTMTTGGFVFDAERLAWRMGEQLTLWSWNGAALQLDAGAKWKKGDFMENIPLRLRGGLLAAAAIANDEVVIGLWPVDSMPSAKALAAVTRTMEPKTLLHVAPWAGGELRFDLDGQGNLYTLESPEYQVALVSRWDTKTGKRLAQKRLEDLDAVDLAVSPDGARVLVLSRDGELCVLDPELAVGPRVKTFKKGKKWGTSVRFAPSGAYFVTSAQELGSGPGELTVWDTAKLAPLATLPVKEATQGFQVRAVCQSALVTTSPLAVFELR